MIGAAFLFPAGPFLLAAAIAVESGGVAVLPLPPDAVAARFKGDGTLVVGNHAIVGIDADAPPGKRSIAVRGADGREHLIDFAVAMRSFPEEHLTVANRRHVDPTAADLERYARERDIQRAAYARRTAVQEDLVPFEMPLAGRISSEFGYRRFFNGEPRARHSGLDIAADTGTAVRAPAPGIVAARGNFFFNGKTVLIDHGGGLVTMYCHLSRVDVEPGAAVARGAVLGAVGATGRVTGPHLHWTVSVRGVRVDPLRFLAAINALPEAY